MQRHSRYNKLNSAKLEVVRHNAGPTSHTAKSAQGPTLGVTPTGDAYVGENPALMAAQPINVHLSPANLVTVNLAASLTGLTEKAIRRKIDDKWVEGVHYHRSPDGGIFISLNAYEKWVLGGKK